MGQQHSELLPCLRHVGVSRDADAPTNRLFYSAGCGRKRGGCLGVSVSSLDVDAGRSRSGETGRDFPDLNSGSQGSHHCCTSGDEQLSSAWPSTSTRSTSSTGARSAAARRCRRALDWLNDG
ncbi:uncharacterized protein LOC144100342 [Amblyomma americanum]